MSSIKDDWTNKKEFTLHDNQFFTIYIVGFSKLQIIKRQVTRSIVLEKNFKLFCCLTFYVLTCFGVHSSPKKTCLFAHIQIYAEYKHKHESAKVDSTSRIQPSAPNM
jgi:hypothetical protein